LASAAGEQLLKKRKQAKERGQQETFSVAILNIGRMHDGMEQQSLGIDGNASLLAVDQFARAEPRWIDARPSFSALLKL
jgi:hypothetical protein